MSVKSLNDNKLHEARLFLLGIASNAQDAAHAAEMITSAGDWYEDEVVRLRALVKEAEYSRTKQERGLYDDPGVVVASCPWCDSAGLPHRPDCRAFEPNGEVR